MSDASPGVTVLIPCYNYAAFVGDAIRSVLAQTHRNIELIVIDDGSKDDSWSVIEPLAQAHGFSAIKNRNKGLVPTVKEGIERATGRYFASLNADDRKLPRAVTMLVELMERDPSIGLAGGACRLIDASGRTVGQVRAARVNGGLGEVLTRRAHLCAPSLLFRTEAVRGEGALDAKFGIDDLQLALYVAAKGWKVAVVPDSLGEYRFHDRNMSQDILTEYRRVCALYECYAAHPDYRAGRAIVADRYARAACLRGRREAMQAALADLRRFGGRTSLKTKLALLRSALLPR